MAEDNRIIAVVSGKGGVGKTVTSLNLGLALQELGEQVIVVDIDMTVSNLGMQLGSFKFEKTLQDVLKKKVPIFDAIYVHPSGLCMIPSSLYIEDIYTNAQTNPKKLRKELKKLKGWVFLDCPPGLNDEALAVLSLADDVLVVTNPEMPAVADAIKVSKIAKKMGKNMLGVIVNRIGKKSYEVTPEEIEVTCELPVLGEISEDENVRKSIANEAPLIKLYPYSRSSVGFKRLAHNISGREFKEPRMLFMKRLFSR